MSESMIHSVFVRNDVTLNMLHLVKSKTDAYKQKRKTGGIDEPDFFQMRNLKYFLLWLKVSY